MKVLILGDSDSAGRFSAGATWPELLEASLASRLQGPAEVVSSPFSAVSDNASEFAEKKLRDTQPDTVVLLLGSFGFTAKFTWLRVQQLFGKRAGRWYRRMEDRFDTSTRSEEGRPGRLNNVARVTVRRVVGTKSFSTRQQIAANYRAVFRVLSRFEDTQVVVMAYPGLGKHATEGKGPELRRLFFAEMRAAAKDHHFTWVDGAEVFSGVSWADVKLDDLHFNARGHAIIAAAVEEALMERAEAPGIAG